MSERGSWKDEWRVFTLMDNWQALVITDQWQQILPGALPKTLLILTGGQEQVLVSGKYAVGNCQILPVKQRPDK